jgi:hypothetical protein
MGELFHPPRYAKAVIGFECERLEDEQVKSAAQ